MWSAQVVPRLRDLAVPEDNPEVPMHLSPPQRKPESTREELIVRFVILVSILVCASAVWWVPATLRLIAHFFIWLYDLIHG